MRAYHWILGYADCRVRGDHAACFFNLCREKEFAYTPIRMRQKKGEQAEDTAFEFRCSLARLSALLQACAQRGIDARAVRRGGLPVLAHRYRKRAGLAVGLLLIIAILFVSGRVVWDVRMEGDASVCGTRLRERLALCGLTVGTWIPSLDTDEVESRLLIESDDIAWVSVNMRGTVAYVQVRELKQPESMRTDDPTNLVASCDGVIESVRLISGEVSVQPGDLVRAGELLVSGVRDSSVKGYGVASAQGEVFARTEHTLTVKVDRVSEQKVYTGQKIVEKTLFFFGKTIKVTKSTGIIEGNCDTIKKLEIFDLGNGAALPVSLETTVLQAYELRPVTLDDEQLTARAYEQLGRALTLATEHATLISKQVSTELTDTGIILVCRYRCVENIAKPLAFDVQSE